MKLDCGCDTLDGTRCTLHEFPWVQAVCPVCGYDRALRGKYDSKRLYCEACGERR